ncbi:dihydroorotase [Paenibacillus cellulosilyticus]|uniref:Dihydroorotase n=1 Tax=Paenibacillus cellulosilyticus TaxID=375489 RepID=A0A2V2YCC3_9BACL|nr:dihydroorotase [Paenibacillus cellulosilyticus]PWV89382.1 dihydroorotase [Paenibacillus cellulosilyticus]QKS43133.1 dihydroorotase [Paenibacillus cellulosilyticus]
MTLWVLNGLIWNEAAGTVESKHVRVEGNAIAEIVDGSTTPETAGAEVVDAAGKLISAGFIDMHVHLRDPGFEYKEDIATGTRSAAAGGFTTIACMPNTRPVTDTAETVKYILDKAAKEGVVRVLPYAAITKNELGRELTDFAALKEAGAIGFTDDGVGVQNAQMMKNAMTLAKSLDMPVIAHCEDDSLVEGAWASEGNFAKKHGLKGIPNESEAIHVGRDALLSEATGVHYHVCHVSTEQSVRLIRLAKSIGVKITAEVCPHHLVLSDEDIPGVDDANWKMNPPLRTPRDVQAVIEGLEDGTIDIVVTDHAPHSAEEKARGPQLAPFGIVGFETAFPLLYTKFVRTGKWKLGFLLQRMTSDPARVFRLPTGRLEVGAPADLTIVDLENEREVRPETFSSKSNNTPFGGWKLYGWTTTTIYNGQVVYNKA